MRLLAHVHLLEWIWYFLNVLHATACFINSKESFGMFIYIHISIYTLPCALFHNNRGRYLTTCGFLCRIISLLLSKLSYIDLFQFWQI